VRLEVPAPGLVAAGHVANVEKPSAHLVSPSLYEPA
jgi:hypothetical protein